MSAAWGARKGQEESLSPEAAEPQRSLNPRLLRFNPWFSCPIPSGTSSTLTEALGIERNKGMKQLRQFKLAGRHT